jgi:hypothetical protein
MTVDEWARRRILCMAAQGISPQSQHAPVTLPASDVLAMLNLIWFYKTHEGAWGDVAVHNAIEKIGRNG